MGLDKPPKQVKHKHPERVAYCEDRLFRRCASPRVVCRDGAIKFGCSIGMMEKYIDAARANWRAWRAANIEQIRDELDGSLREVIERAIDNEDLNAAQNAIKTLAILHGALTSPSVNVAVNASVTTIGDPAAARRRLAELEASPIAGSLNPPTAHELDSPTIITVPVPALAGEDDE